MHSFKWQGASGVFATGRENIRLVGVYIRAHKQQHFEPGHRMTEWEQTAILDDGSGGLIGQESLIADYRSEQAWQLKPWLPLQSRPASAPVW